MYNKYEDREVSKSNGDDCSETVCYYVMKIKINTSITRLQSL